MYEGAPDWPRKDRFWEIIERHGVTIFYNGADRHPRVHALGTEWPASAISARSACSIGRRTDQSGRHVVWVSP